MNSIVDSDYKCSTGEMHSVETDKATTTLALPKSGNVAYAAQESWVLSDTIRVSTVQSHRRLP